MNYTVTWKPSAERELANLWLNAADRQAVLDGVARGFHLDHAAGVGAVTLLGDADGLQRHTAEFLRRVFEKSRGRAIRFENRLIRRV